MGAVSGASGGAGRVAWSVLLGTADCSLALGRRSVFIFLSASPRTCRGGGRRPPRHPTATDDSTRRRPLNKKGVRWLCLTARGRPPIFSFCPPLLENRRG